jgi:hypothetical protein
LYYLVKDHQEIQVTPVIMHGLGGSLPRGEALFVPFNCDVIIDDPLTLSATSSEYTQQLSERFKTLLPLCLTH